MTVPFARLGWEPAPGEGERTPTLRAQLIGMLGTVGEDEVVRTECAAGATPPPSPAAPTSSPTWPATIVNVAATVGGPSEFETFLELYRHPTTPQEETRYLYSLSRLHRPGAGGSGLRAGPHRGPDTERAVRRPAAAGQP